MQLVHGLLLLLPCREPVHSLWFYQIGALQVELNNRSYRGATACAQPAYVRMILGCMLLPTDCWLSQSSWDGALGWSLMLSLPATPNELHSNQSLLPCCA